MQPATTTNSSSSSAELLAALHSIQAGLGRHRPLARVRQQLLGDLAALLTGLRCVVMLDYAPGATPQQLGQALAPLQQTLPGWAGCTLELEGCCYLANSTTLLQQLSQLAADTHSWPVVLGFAGGEPQQLQQEGLEQLQQQLTQLPAAVASVLSPPPAGGQAGGGWLPHVKLDDCPGLPAMPTLNGLLLGYPVVYYVRDQEDAAVASRVLSRGELTLHRVLATCGAQLGAALSRAGADGDGDGLVVVVMAFTVPAALMGCADAAPGAVVGRVRSKLQQLQQQAQRGALWKAVDLVVEGAGHTVSL